jgi:hypothetical protein
MDAASKLMKVHGLTLAQAEHFLTTGEKVSAEYAKEAIATDAEHTLTDLSGGPSEAEEGQASIIAAAKAALG